MKALKKAIGDTVLTPLSSIPVFLNWQIWSINDPLVGFQTTMVPICAQTISYWGEHQVQFLRAHSAIRRILVIDLNSSTFCHSEAESLLHFFWECEITQDFWINVFSWLKSCQIINIFPQVHTALGLRPDRSKNNLQINFCLLLAKHYIWLCKHKTTSPKLNGFLCYFKHIHTIEKKPSDRLKEMGTICTFFLTPFVLSSFLRCQLKYLS